MDEAELVQRAAAGDKDAFAAIYDRYAGRLYDFLWWVLQDRQEAEDALHDTFLVAGTRLPELTDPNRLRPWLFAVAGRVALDSERHRSAKHPSADEWEVAPTSAAAEAPVAGELVELARETADELSATDRALLDLHLRQGLKGQELADAIGVSSEYARHLVTQLIDRIERSLGTDLVARYGRHQCPELAALLADWDERRDPETRARVAEHADACPTCGARRRQRVGTAALLAVAPTFAPPGDVRGRVLDDVDLEEHDERSWPTRRGGFPRPLVGGPDRRWLLLAAAAFVIVVALVAFLVTRTGHKSEQRVSSVGSTTVPGAGPSTTATTRPAPATSTLPGTGGVPNGAVAGTSGTGSGGGSGSAGGGTAAGGAGTGGGSQASGTGGGGTAGGTDASGDTGGGGGGGGGGSSGGSSGGGSSGGGSSDTGTTAPAPTTTTTTLPPDNEGPVLGGLTVSPSVVRAGSQCDTPTARTATITIHASDPSGIGSISVVAGPSATAYPMANVGGDTYTATVGPFETLIPSGQTIPFPVIVQATDSLGNGPTSRQGTLTIACG
jgi:RNA polymerase sigma factor (sigma-70 family)